MACRCSREEEAAAGQEQDLAAIQQQTRALQSLRAAAQAECHILSQQHACWQLPNASTAERQAAARARLEQQSAELQAAAAALAGTAGELARLCKGPRSEWLLSQQDMQAYERDDLRFRQELNRFYQKQFQEGPAAALSQQHACPAWLREHDPAATSAQVLRVLKGDGSAAFMRRTAELQRLAWIYPTSRMQHIVARAWQAKQEAALQAAQASEGVAVQEPWLVHSEVDFLERQVQQAQGRKQELLQRQVPELCAELAGLQDVSLLEQDYTRKLKRQLYYFQRKQRFMQLIRGQTARHHVMQLARDREARQVQSTRDREVQQEMSAVSLAQQELQSLVTLAQQQLQELQAVTQLRLESYAAMRASQQAEPQRLTLHSQPQLFSGTQLQHAELSMPELLDCIDELLLSNTQLANSVQVMEAEIRTHENIIQQRGAPLQAERHVLTAFHTDPAWLATQVTA
eukprot:jgi/Astpho2/8994/fgenesh1_pg.00133_%23_38_t